MGNTTLHVCSNDDCSDLFHRADLKQLLSTKFCLKSTDKDFNRAIAQYKQSTSLLCPNCFAEKFFICSTCKNFMLKGLCNMCSYGTLSHNIRVCHSSYITCGGTHYFKASSIKDVLKNDHKLSPFSGTYQYIYCDYKKSSYNKNCCPRRYISTYCQCHYCKSATRGSHTCKDHTCRIKRHRANLAKTRNHSSSKQNKSTPIYNNKSTSIYNKKTDSESSSHYTSNRDYEKFSNKVNRDYNNYRSQQQENKRWDNYYKTSEAIYRNTGYSMSVDSRNYM